MKWAAVGKIYTQSRDLAVRISHLRIKIIPKGMKWIAAGEICTQSRDLIH